MIIMASKIEFILLEKGLKKGFVANQIGISAGSFSRIINGETKEPRLSIAIKLARFLDSTVEELFGHLVD